MIHEVIWLKFLLLVAILIKLYLVILPPGFDIRSTRTVTDFTSTKLSEVKSPVKREAVRKRDDEPLLHRKEISLGGLLAARSGRIAIIRGGIAFAFVLTLPGPGNSAGHKILA